MSESMNTSSYEKKAISIIHRAGYSQTAKITCTLQGSIWRAVHKSSNKQIVIKVSNKNLTDQQMVIVNNTKYNVHENIINEKKILKYLTKDRKSCPQSIIKYVDYFKSNLNHYLVMDDGGDNLFTFIQKAHEYISNGSVDVSNWHKLAQIIFKQMVESIEYIHSKNVCHFDISLENWVISDIEVQCNDDGKFEFCLDNDIQCKLCDFGLAEYFPNSTFSSTKYCGKAMYQSPEIVDRSKSFNAKSNDIFCLGVSYFMMIVGCAPFHKASNSDKAFTSIINGGLSKLLKKWKKEMYINEDIMELFDGFFQFEDERMDMIQIKNSKFYES